jgi:hypothetical protein
VLEAVVSSLSTHMFGGRNLAASTPAVLLLLGALYAGAGRRLRIATIALAVIGFAFGTAKMLEARFERPDNQAAATYVERNFRPGDAVIDELVALSPGPLSPLDTVLRGGIPVIRAGNPAERDHPFNFFDPVVPLRTAAREAASRFPTGRIFVVANVFPNAHTTLGAIGESRIATGSATAGAPRAPDSAFPRRYRVIASRRWPGFPAVRVEVYAARTAR